MRFQPTAGQGSLATHVQDNTGWLVIDNEQRRNAMTLEMWTNLPDALDKLDSDPEVRLIIVRGAGEATFVSGADISEFEQTRGTADAAQNYDRINVAAFDALRRTTKPTLAMIRGHCLGGGLGLALACDLRLASSDAVFGIPAARLGIAYPVDAMTSLVQAIGPSNAKKMMFTAERLNAEEALRLGLISELVEPEALEERCRQLAQTMSENAPLTLAAAKLAIDLAADPANQTLAPKAHSAAIRCFESSDFTEGRDAFLEKRQPAFEGK